MKMSRLLLFCGGPFVVARLALAAAPLAATPPMGWNSWNHFQTRISDVVVRAQADALVSSGLRDAGYVYVNIDDGWQGTRGPDGAIRGNEHFPDMKALADYLHARGLKLGLYSSPGTKTCAGFAGSFGHEEQDAATYAAWGVDYLKYDLCSYNDEAIARLKTEAEREAATRAAYAKMSAALRRTGRPIVFSLCQYGLLRVWQWGESVGGNSWRTTGDIGDAYPVMAAIGFGQAGLALYAGPGHWNDPDMLEIGNGGMTAEEYRTHMTLWALLAAPLIAGNDLTKMTPETLALLANREVIAIDQDPAGQAGDRVWVEGPYEIWARPLADGGKAVGVFNRQDTWTGAATVEVDLRHLGYAEGAHVRDVWRGVDLGKQQELSLRIAAHGCVLLKTGR
jgi:alpha-galactosidase